MPLPAPLAILRPGNALMAAVAVAAGAFVAAGVEVEWWRPLVGSLVAFAFAGAGNAANDLRDVEIDRRAHPERPLPSGALTERGVLAAVVLLYAAAVAGAFALGPAAAALVVASLLVMEAYERGLKARGLPGNVAVAALTAAPFVLGGLAVGALPPAVLALAALAALSTLGREILKDVEDMMGDAGRRTLPQRVGARTAGRFAAGALAAAVLFSPLPFLVGESVLGWTYLPAVCLADLAFLRAATSAGTPGRAQRTAKAAMLLALAAFLLGRAQVVW